MAYLHLKKTALIRDLIDILTVIIELAACPEF